LIPTPTWAAVIIFTSLAPSPIASVEADLFQFLTRDTIYYFYLGETLQQSTASQYIVIFTIISATSFSRPWIKASPVIIKALLVYTSSFFYIYISLDYTISLYTFFNYSITDYLPFSSSKANSLLS